jgi:hypothetical protein
MEIHPECMIHAGAMTEEKRFFYNGLDADASTAGAARCRFWMRL